MSLYNRILETMKELSIKSAVHLEDLKAIKVKIGPSEEKTVNLFFIPNEEIGFLRIFIPVIDSYPKHRVDEIRDYIMYYNTHDIIYGALTLFHSKEEDKYYLGYNYSICLKRGDSDYHINEFEIDEIFSYISYLIDDVTNNLIKVQ